MSILPIPNFPMWQFSPPPLGRAGNIGGADFLPVAIPGAFGGFTSLEAAVPGLQVGEISERSVIPPDIAVPAFHHDASTARLLRCPAKHIQLSEGHWKEREATQTRRQGTHGLAACKLDVLEPELAAGRDEDWPGVTALEAALSMEWGPASKAGRNSAAEEHGRRQTGGGRGLTNWQASQSLRSLDSVFSFGSGQDEHMPLTAWMLQLKARKGRGS